jgi:dienelactone hydrolase
MTIHWRTLISLLIIATLSTLATCIFLPIAEFPEPTGHYGVGYTTYHWVDTTRQELNAQDPIHPNRELMIHVFFPTEKKNNATPINYDPDAAKSAIEYLAMCSKLPAWLFGNIKLIKTHMQTNAPLAQNTTPFPVVIFSHGAGGPMVQSYTWILEELASHGFVVVGINHPYMAGTVRYPDGRVITSIYEKMKREGTWKLDQVETNALDISFVINKIEESAIINDPFWKCVDVHNVGVFGHSFGGRTTFRATLMDKRIKCGINMDGGVDERDGKEQFSTPFMFMHPEKSFIRDKNHPFYIFKGKPVKEKSEDTWYEKLARNPDSSMKIVTIKDVGHAIFTDVPFELNMTALGRFLSRHACFHLEVPAERAIDIFTNNVMPQIINFFDEKLLNSKNGDEKNNARKFV